MHLNAIKFLEPPPFSNLTLEAVEFNGNIIEVDIGLRHPFLGLTQFTGFDVCGILITSGSVSGFEDEDIVLAGEGDTRLLNPDGYSRWWNPTEFPVNEGTMKSYNDGLLGVPYATGGFTGTVNAYKYFCDELDVDEPIGNVDPSGRGIFNAGQKNVRKYIIEKGSGLVFNYAIDACWKYPAGGPPWTAPDDFGAAANRNEAWRISVTEISNTLYNDGDLSGGDLYMSIDVYDWFDAGMNSLLVESPGNFDAVPVTSPSGGGVGYSTYAVDIIDADPISAGLMDILISVISEQENFQDFVTGVNTTAYFIHSTDVSGEPVDYIEVTVPNGGESWAAASSQEITWDSMGDTTDVLIEYSKDDFGTDIHEIIDTTPNDGSFMWDPVASDPTTTAKVRITDVVDPLITDVSDDYFSITMLAIYVDDSNTSGTEDGTMAHPYNTIQEGLAAATTGYYVLVDDSGNDYTGPVTLKTDVILKSQNWDISDGGDEAAIFSTGTSPVVNGADDATIDGFKIYGGSSYGVRINGVDTTMINCWVTDIDTPTNYTVVYGIRVDNSTGSLIEDCEIDEIRITTTIGYCDLFGIGLYNSPITVTGCTIHHLNSAGRRVDPGGGIYASNCAPSGSDHLKVYGNEVHNITGTDRMYNYYGIYVGGSNEAEIYHNEITTVSGGTYSYSLAGMYVNGSSDVDVNNNIVNGVTCGSYGTGYGMRFNNCANLDMINNVIYDTEMTGYYGTAYGVYITANCTTFNGRNNIVNRVRRSGGFQNAYGVYGATPSNWQYNDVYDTSNGIYTGGTPGIGCISANPLFVSTASPFNFHLQTGSPCIDAGDPDPSYNDTDTTRNDMGCYGGPDGNW